jgi:hypothetical protein
MPEVPYFLLKELALLRAVLDRLLGTAGTPSTGLGSALEMHGQ